MREIVIETAGSGNHQAAGVEDASPASLRNAIAAAEAGLGNPAAEDLVTQYFQATAGTRPAPDQPGRLGEQLRLADLYLQLPPRVRRDNGDPAWGEVRRHVLPHARPLSTQAEQWRNDGQDSAGHDSGNFQQVKAQSSGVVISRQRVSRPKGRRST